MTQVVFEPDTGRLRLDRATFDTLADWAAGNETAGPAMGDLRATGVIDVGRPHSAVAAGLDAVTHPACLLRADLHQRDGDAETGEVWVSRRPAAGLLLPLPDGMAEFITMGPTFLPVVVARFVELGPRPRLPAGPVPAGEELLAALTTADPRGRDAAVAELARDAPDESTRQAVTAVGPELQRDWCTCATWTAPGGDRVGRILRVLDTTAGLWLARPQRDPTAQAETIWPTTPTTVWRYLTGLLPDDDELG